MFHPFHLVSGPKNAQEINRIGKKTYKKMKGVF